MSDESKGSPLAWLSGASNFLLDAFRTGWGVYTQYKTWEREDTEVQRRMKDLKEAGLSPVLAAGGGASTSAPISLGQPQGGWFEKAAQAALLRQDYSRSQADIDLTREQVKGKEIENKYAGTIAELTIQERMFDMALKNATMESSVLYAARQAQDMGNRVRIGEVEAAIKELYGLMGEDLNQTMKEIALQTSRLNLSVKDQELANLLIAGSTAAWNLKYFKERGLPVQGMDARMRLLQVIEDKIGTHLGGVNWRAKVEEYKSKSLEEKEQMFPRYRQGWRKGKD